MWTDESRSMGVNCILQLLCRFVHFLFFFFLRWPGAWFYSCIFFSSCWTLSFQWNNFSTLTGLVNSDPSKEAAKVLGKATGVSLSHSGHLVAKSCLTLCDPVDCSPPGFSVPGISQARILEWVAISFSKVCTFSKWRRCVQTSLHTGSGTRK